MAEAGLPEPDSDELRSIAPGRAQQAIYAFLFSRRHTWVSMPEIESAVEPAIGRQTQLGRRRRDLNPHFEIESRRFGRETKYRLAGRKSEAQNSQGISEKVRAEVLQWGRCAMCGRRALEDDVRLQVDHRIPQSLGGGSEMANLQPLCEECNRGKKNLLKEHGEYADRIACAIVFDEPQRRIGELLRACEGEWVRSDILELVAHAGGYQ